MAPPGLHGPGQSATRGTDASLELVSSSTCATGVLDPGGRPAFAWRRVSPLRSLSPRASKGPGVRLSRAGSVLVDPHDLPLRRSGPGSLLIGSRP